MNTDNIWIALATFGRVRIPLADNMLSALDTQWIRNQLNSEADSEGVSLRINSIMKGDCMQGFDVSLRKFT